MVAGTLESGRLPTWHLALRSFVPVRHRAVADPLVGRLPLAVLLIVQGLFAVRLEASVFQDEALYVYTGHWIVDSWLTGEPLYTNPAAFFSGAPQLYPVLAAGLDSIGGLGLVRLFSTVCMLGATVAVHMTARALFGRRAALLAAAVFAMSTPVMFLGHFATFDAVSFAAVAWALAVGVWSAAGDRSLWWSVVVGVLAASAVLLKYSSAIDVPFVLAAVVPAGLGMSRLVRLVQRAVLAGAVTVALLVGSVLTWAAPLLAGLRQTTTDRSSLVLASPWDLAGDAALWAGVPFALAVIGGVLIVKRRPLLGMVLLGGTLAAPVYQINMGESVSFHKHLALGLILGAPAAGALLDRLWRARFGAAAVVAVLWLGFMQGVTWSDRLWSVWPDTRPLASVLEYSVDAMPWIRMVGDNPEPLQYGLRPITEPWQFTATYEGSFFYEGLSGAAAYEKALQDNYFQLAFLDGSNGISAGLLPRMAEFGFQRTATVEDPRTGHEWQIWQRFDSIE